LLDTADVCVQVPMTVPRGSRGLCARAGDHAASKARVARCCAVRVRACVGPRAVRHEGQSGRRMGLSGLSAHRGQAERVLPVEFGAGRTSAPAWPCHRRSRGVAPVRGVHRVAVSP
jgi:hypothetical protein